MIPLNSKKEKIELKDLSFKKIYHYLRSKYRKRFGGIRIQEEDLVLFSEIIVYRSLCCPDCVKDKACLKSKGGCGCPVPQLFAALGAECGRGEKRWHSINEKDWRENWTNYKEKVGLQIFKVYNK